MASRDALIREDLRRRAEQPDDFRAHMRARTELFARNWGEDPWSEPALAATLAQEVGRKGLVGALEDAGRALLQAGHLEAVRAWTAEMVPADPAERAALAVVRGFLYIRAGENERAAALLSDLPDVEAVALHGLALLQLGQADASAARLEVLLAANALDEQGDLAPRLLPEPLPALSLFLSACLTAARRHLTLSERPAAERLALAARDALRRYAQAELPEGPERAEVAELLQRVAG